MEIAAGTGSIEESNLIGNQLETENEQLIQDQTDIEVSNPNATQENQETMNSGLENERKNQETVAQVCTEPDSKDTLAETAQPMSTKVMRHSASSGCLSFKQNSDINRQIPVTPVGLLMQQRLRRGRLFSLFHSEELTPAQLDQLRRVRDRSGSIQSSDETSFSGHESQQQPQQQQQKQQQQQQQQQQDPSCPTRRFQSADDYYPVAYLLTEDASSTVPTVPPAERIQTLELLQPADDRQRPTVKVVANTTEPEQRLSTSESNDQSKDLPKQSDDFRLPASPFAYVPPERLTPSWSFQAAPSDLRRRRQSDQSSSALTRSSAQDCDGGIGSSKVMQLVAKFQRNGST